MDTIRIKGLRADIYLGVYPEEQIKPRPIVIDYSLEAELSKACASDNLEDTVDYHTLSQKILSAVAPSSGKRFFLIEHVANVIATIIFDFDCRIASAIISVTKPNAFEDVESAEVVLHRVRSS